MDQNCCPKGLCNDRWACTGLFVDRGGSAPLNCDTLEKRLEFLATATPEELSELAHTWHTALTNGDWQGYPCSTGGWVDGPPWDDNQRPWREVAADFVNRYEAGDRTLTEGMLLVDSYDLCRELAWLQGWCGRQSG